MDRLLEWRLFVTAATLRSFVATARQLGRSPQSVTRAIADLEKRLGTRLLHRTTRSVTLTADGARYLESGSRVLGAFDELESPPSDRQLSGTLTVSASVLFGQLHVLPVVTAFLAAHPLVNVRLGLVDRVVSLAEEGIDIAVRIGALPDSALRAQKVGVVQQLTCASPAYLAAAGRPRTPADLGKHQCIGFSATVVDHWTFPRPPGHTGRRSPLSIAIHPRLTVNTAQAAIDAALAGFGVVRLLSYQVDRLISDGKLVAILTTHQPPPSPVHLVSLPGVSLRAATRFAEFAASHLSHTLRRR